MSIPQGKGIFIWNSILSGFGGNPAGLADELQAGGFSHVTFKGLQSTFTYAPNAAMIPAVVPLLKERGISTRVYQYIEGGSNAHAQTEAAAAVANCVAWGVDGLEIDAEAEYNQAATQAAAKGWALAYMGGLNAMPASVSVSLCSYRYPSVQPWFPWAEFLNHPRLDFVMPQVYWQGAVLPASAGWQLTKSRAEYQALAPSLPYVPVGSAYCEHGWCSSPAQVQNFSDMAQTLNLPGISLWSLQHLPTIAGMKATVYALDWPPPDPDPDPDPLPVPPPGDCEPLPQLKVLTNGLKVRSEPKVSNPYDKNVIGTLAAGAVVDVFDLAIETGKRVWVRHAETEEWSAVVYEGTQHMEETE